MGDAGANEDPIQSFWYMYVFPVSNWDSRRDIHIYTLPSRRMK